jgi:hypothetical protein
MKISIKNMNYYLKFVNILDSKLFIFNLNISINNFVNFYFLFYLNNINKYVNLNINMIICKYT